MADNVTAGAAVGVGPDFATDEIALIHHPKAKMEWGPDGTANSVDDASGQRLPVNVAESALLGGVAETAPATDTASSGLNGRLQRIAQRLTSLVALLPASLGTKTAAASLAVTLASDGTFVVQTGSLTETAPATDTASSGLNGRLQRVAQHLTSLLARLPAALGQQVKADSLAVTLASDQGALPITDNGGSLTIDGAVTVSGTATVSGTVTANAGTNLNTSLLALEAGGNLAAIKTDVDRIPAQGQALAASSLPVVLTAAQITTLTPPAAIAGFALEATQAAEAVLVGAVTETAPATDTASSGLNGRLQRIAQRLTSLIALLPAALVSGRLDVNLGAAPATVTVTGTMTDGGAGKTLKTAVVALAASGNVIAAVSGKIIKVYAYEIQSRNDSMTAQAQDDLAGNNVTIRWTLNAREGAMAGAVNPPAFLFKNSAQNKPIYLTITGTGTVDCVMRYYDDDAS